MCENVGTADSDDKREGSAKGFCGLEHTRLVSSITTRRGSPHLRP